MKIGGIRGQAFSVFSVQNSVAKKDLTVSSTDIEWSTGNGGGASVLNSSCRKKPTGTVSHLPILKYTA
jgi:hypothetical protein